MPIGSNIGCRKASDCARNVRLGDSGPAEAMARPEDGKTWSAPSGVRGTLLRKYAVTSAQRAVGVPSLPPND